MGFDAKICTLLMGDEAEPLFPRSTRSRNERIAEHFDLEAVPPHLLSEKFKAMKQSKCTSKVT